MKAPIELNMPDDRMFLNFWNWDNGNDVACEIKGEKLLLMEYDDDMKKLPPKEITFGKFFQMVKSRMEAMESNSKD